MSRRNSYFGRPNPDAKPRQSCQIVPHKTAGKHELKRIREVLYRVLRDHEDGKSLCNVQTGALSPGGSWVLEQTIERLVNGYSDPRDTPFVPAEPLLTTAGGAA